MIAVDTSALMAIVLDEPQADACISALDRDLDCVISAGTVSEALIVAGRHNVKAEVARLIDGLGMEGVAVTHETARRVADAYAVWDTGIHPAGLNFGDCFAYVMAKERNCPLLFVGDDFTKTDVERAA
ncbi:type II toxin-antitoxin system VapC family toxin [Lichenihabitans psoromatis]|uniref:type II toxin-antitoxin system VapC family toxin n=1 Tax=Lichenihabitans psoromatis TaxID=2528642 RepID=UPI0010369A1B|nr:type II toxin-antitoxin system VapC family toxin [Lichenihabitans psoromatis]